MSTQPQPNNGLFQDRGYLVVDFEHKPKFPPQCIFTLEPVTKLTKMKVNIPNLKGRGLAGVAVNLVFNNHQLLVDLPISEKWQADRANKTKRVIKALWIVTLVVFVLGAISALVGFAFFREETPVVFGMRMGGIVGMMFSPIIALVAFLYPKLEQPVSPDVIDGIRLDPPYVWLPNVHDTLLDSLPTYQHPKGSTINLFGG